MREKSIRYRAPEQLRQRSRREALEPPSGTTLPIRYRRMAEETARSEPEGRGTPSGGRAATDDKTARKPRPEAGRNPRTTTAGAEPQRGDRRKNDGAVPEGDGSEQVRYEVLCQCFSHPDSEEATSIHTSFS